MTAQVFTASWSTMWEVWKRGPLPLLPVRVSNQTPKYWPAAAAFPTCDLLIPAKWIAFGDEELGKREKAYRAALHRAGVERINVALDAIADEAGGQSLGLCCFCRSTEGCHRLWLSRWMQEQTGTGICEIGSLHAAHTPEQLTLVHEQEGSAT